MQRKRNDLSEKAPWGGEKSLFTHKRMSWNYISTACFITCCTVSRLPGKNVLPEYSSIPLISQGQSHMASFMIFLQMASIALVVLIIPWGEIGWQNHPFKLSEGENSTHGWELSCLFCCWHLVYLITSTIQPSVGSTHDIICIVLLCLKLCPIKEFYRAFYRTFYSIFSVLILSKVQFQIHMKYTSKALILWS